MLIYMNHSPGKEFQACTYMHAHTHTHTHKRKQRAGRKRDVLKGGERQEKGRKGGVRGRRRGRSGGAQWYGSIISPAARGA